MSLKGRVVGMENFRKTAPFPQGSLLFLKPHTRRLTHTQESFEQTSFPRGTVFGMETYSISTICARKSFPYGRRVHTKMACVRKLLPYKRLFRMKCLRYGNSALSPLRVFCTEEPSVRNTIPLARVLRTEASSIQRALLYAVFFGTEGLPFLSVLCTEMSSFRMCFPYGENLSLE